MVLMNESGVDGWRKKYLTMDGVALRRLIDCKRTTAVGRSVVGVGGWRRLVQARARVCVCVCFRAIFVWFVVCLFLFFLESVQKEVQTTDAVNHLGGRSVVAQKRQQRSRATRGEARIIYCASKKLNAVHKK